MTLSMHLKGDFIMSKEFDNKEFFFDVYDVILLTFKLEDIKKRWEEYTELYKKYLQGQDNQDGVITHLELDVLESEVKWALESITTNKASGGDGIPVELFQILNDDAVKVLHSICQQIWKTHPNFHLSFFYPLAQ